jgi:hypothetical protein
LNGYDANVGFHGSREIRLVILCSV